MNPVLVFLVILAAVTVWFLLSFVFYPLGRLIFRIGKDAVEQMEREDKNEKEREKINNEER